MIKLFCFIFISYESFANQLSFKESVHNSYQSGDYTAVIKTTNKLDSKLNRDGYLSYLRGSSFLELNQFEEAKFYLADAISKNNKEKDIYYKLGQSTFALEEYKQSRIYFKKSIKRGFKRAVSLYYIGFSSSKLKDFKTAVRIYSTIEKLPRNEKKDVVQAARLQIADIYFEQVKVRDNFFNAIKNYVLPQYEKALNWDKKSILAQEIKRKIQSIEQRYEIVLYKMRNGRKTSIPRYFLKAGLYTGYESNINSLTDSSIEVLNSEDVSGIFGGSSLFGRYSFYPNSKFSYSPELSLSYKNYISSSDSVNSNDELSIKLGNFFTYEHFLFKSAATSSLRLDYNLRATDFEVDSSYSLYTNYFTITLSEEFQYFLNNPTIIRFVNTTLTSDLETSSYTSNSFVLEQLINKANLMYYFYLNYDMIRYADNETEDINRLTLRADFIFNSFYDIVNLGPYLSLTSSDFINDVDDKSTNLLQLGLNINRPIVRKVYLNTDISYESQSGDETTDYSGLRFLLSIDYIY